MIAYNPKAWFSQIMRFHKADTVRFARSDALQRSSARTELKLPLERDIALYVGVLDKRKNILWLAEQWVAQRGFGTGALLLAVGPQARDDP